MNMPKVLVVGIDAMDPQFVSLLMEQGKLPHFKKLHFHSLQTTLPPETPVAWSAASTGSNPGRYGIFDFLTRDKETYMPRLNLAEEKPGLVKTSYSCAMRGLPFWRILSQADRKVTVVRWPVTFPAEKINGRMLSGLGVVDIRGSMNSYSFYTSNPKFLEGDGREKCILVNPENQKVQTELRGPFIRKRGQLKQITVPMEIELLDKEVRINVSEQSFVLRVGEWSPILSVKFRVLPFHDLHGVCNMYLQSLGESFELYVSSVQIDPANQAVEISSPPAYGKELWNEIGAFYTLGMAEDTKAVTEGRLKKEAFFQQVHQIEAERERMFWYEFERFEEGVLAVIFDAGDRLCHIAWQNGKGKKEVPIEIEQYYLNKDKMLGQLLSRLDGQTQLIILSDHGFSDFERQVNLNSWLVQEGYMKLKQSESTELFAQVDWSETSAFALGFTSIFLNQEGREAQGIVPESDSAALVEEIVNKLLRLRDGDRSVFTNVYASSEQYHGEFAAEAPDIILGFAPGFRMAWRSAIGGVDEQIISDNQSPWQGDHLIDPSHVPGVLFTNFEIKNESPRIIDVAPTILQLMQVAVPESIDGESLL